MKGYKCDRCRKWFPEEEDEENPPCKINFKYAEWDLCEECGDAIVKPINDYRCELE